MKYELKHKLPKLRSVHPDHHIDQGHGHDCDNHGEVADIVPAGGKHVKL